MDTELARTFLTVVAAGNFSLASSRLFITQSTVSARIATLESQLGCRLFVRNKSGTKLTAAGYRFQIYANTLVRTVERARQDIGVVRGFRSSITIGGRFGLWEELLLPCLPQIREAVGNVAIRAEIGFEDDLMQGLVEARTDIGVMYTPQRRPGMLVEPLFEEHLVYVSSTPDSVVLPENDYVYVDWGPEFANQHNAAFPEFNGAAIAANTGWIGLQHILSHCGAGFFPLRLVKEELARGQLHRHQELPEFVLPTYLVYHDEADPDTVGLAVAVLRDAAAAIMARA
ncbi:LysR family transcriptional regulator [Parahaliea sp. F7430]|uniref:LysR family transcriptional regulator n=1 Tax=Sediminihaliea albiluteola TaxID=2758564 RepID=A0A7W2YIJ5_9GAMM|nr:LysR family transcriptional regulator [Sediminihaliea albiluteola]MBA6411589.1 LysR family transcriptional regulator [Sediminihaliea albiluteola]